MATRRTRSAGGRHRAAPSPATRTGRVRETRMVRPDAILALRDAVEATGETFEAAEWTFGQSTILVTVASRVTPAGHGRDRLVVSSECRTAWLGEGHDPEAVTGDLSRSSSLARNQIEWLLDDAVRLGTGEWVLRPLGDAGWVCSRATRIGVTRHFAVAPNLTYAPVAAPDPETGHTALAALVALAAEPSGPAVS